MSEPNTTTTAAEDDDDKTNNNNNNMALQVHPNPDPEPVVEIEEDIVEEEDEVEPAAATTKEAPLQSDEQQNLEPVADSDLPPDDINEPTEEYVEVPYEPPQKIEPTPVVIDEGLPEGDVNQQQSGVIKTTTTTRMVDDDQCCQFRCCNFPNGSMQVLFAQFFLFCGIMLCSWAMVDCQFIRATAGFPEPYYPSTYTYWNTWPGAPPTPAPSSHPTLSPRPDQRRGFGFVYNETETNGCALWDTNYRYFHPTEFENYLDFLGSDWDVPRVLGGVALAMGWMLFLSMFSMWCCSFVRGFRWLAAVVVFLVMSGFQASTFAVLGSSFCDEPNANCEPDRGFWMMLGGIVSYWIAAMFFCCMRDFPGPVA